MAGPKEKSFALQPLEWNDFFQGVQAAIAQSRPDENSVIQTKFGTYTLSNSDLLSVFQDLSSLDIRDGSHDSQIGLSWARQQFFSENSLDIRALDMKTNSEVAALASYLQKEPIIFDTGYDPFHIVTAAQFPEDFAKAVEVAHFNGATPKKLDEIKKAFAAAGALPFRFTVASQGSFTTIAGISREEMKILGVTQQPVYAIDLTGDIGGLGDPTVLRVGVEHEKIHGNLPTRLGPFGFKPDDVYQKDAALRKVRAIRAYMENKNRALRSEKIWRLAFNDTDPNSTYFLEETIVVAIQMDNTSNKKEALQVYAATQTALAAGLEQQFQADPEHAASLLFPKMAHLVALENRFGINPQVKLQVMQFVRQRLPQLEQAFLKVVAIHESAIAVFLG